MRVAANDLFITRTVVSSAIKDLECHLGVELFSHSCRGLTLTAAGEALYRGALALLANGDQLTARVGLLADNSPIPYGIGHTPNLAPSEVFTIIEPVDLEELRFRSRSGRSSPSKEHARSRPSSGSRQTVGNPWLAVRYVVMVPQADREACLPVCEVHSDFR
ncbi:LysR family transcriptional regulator [Gordonia tangerina]|uniref:LysR family transcriptional regulator n=2 Tax=Gordoniaceae TaxID=85026 RepID=A0ABS9DNJ0_9ACTN|nr:LysR family transcriptional regulator [Gordonia tangerina]MCF3940162.1 LysR family transcriptional regulator [Gordonia tangerina]